MGPVSFTTTHLHWKFHHGHVRERQVRNPWARPWLEPDRRIDYVFAGYPNRGGVGLVETCRVVCDDEVDGVWPSDHFGVYAELRTDPLPGLPADPGTP